MGTVKSVDGYNYIRYQRDIISDDEMLERSRSFYEWVEKRRSVRHFSDRPIAQEVIENLIMAASAAPSGAHKQPWTFCVVTDPEMKRRIRIAAEEEEYESYHGRMSEEWLQDLQPLGTDWHKPFLDTVPALIVVFRRSWEYDSDGSKHQNYYVQESCGLAVGFLLAAIHHVGLVALTHTPSPMNFLSQILQRPDNEKPYLLIPVGYPSDDCWVPDLKRKGIDKVMVWY
jgi:iodotyrosine deiodinase